MSWKWCLKICYWYVTVWCYLQLGLSLVQVQARHSLLRPIYLFCREHRCRWWGLFRSSWDIDTVTVTAESRATVLCGCEGAVKCLRRGRTPPRTPLGDVDATPRRSCYQGDPQRLSARTVSETQTPAACALRTLLHRLLSETQDVLHITHSEAVEVRLMRMMMRQCDALYQCGSHSRNCPHSGNCGICSISQCGAGTSGSASDCSDDEDEDTLFLLSKTDAYYARALQSGQPVRVSYAEAVSCVHTLSQILAWELFILSLSPPSCAASRAKQPAYVSRSVKATDTNDTAYTTTQKSKTTRSEAAKGVTSTAEPPEKVATRCDCSALHRPHNRLCPAASATCAWPIHSSCVALMLPNSVEFNLIWLACARAGTLETILSHLYASDTSLSVHEDIVDGNNNARHIETGRDAEPLPPFGDQLLCTCEIALLNTNLASNDMLFHALECVGCAVVILDIRYAYLLFVTGESRDDTRTRPSIDSRGATIDAGTPEQTDTKHTHTGKSTAADEQGDEVERTTSAESRARRLHVPPTVRRIFLWRGDDPHTAAPHAADESSRAKTNSGAALTVDMREAIDRFNTDSYAHAPRILCNAYASYHSVEQAARQHARDAPAQHSQATPVLDLAVLLSRGKSVLSHEPYVMTKSTQESSAGMRESTTTSSSAEQPKGCVAAQSMRCTDGSNAHLCEHHKLVASCEYLVESILSHPPTWLASIAPQRATNTTAQVVNRFTATTATSTNTTNTTNIVITTTKTTSEDNAQNDDGTDTTKPVVHAAHTGHTENSAARADHDAPMAGVSTAHGTTTTLVLTGRRHFAQRLRRSLQLFQPTQTLMYIYTSGTTGGRPKAARFSHLRFFSTCFLSRVLRLRDQTRRLLQPSPHRSVSPTTEQIDKELDRITIYNCLPMYHTVGCVFCLGHLMHALEEQQQHQGILRRRRWCRHMRSLLSFQLTGCWLGRRLSGCVFASSSAAVQSAPATSAPLHPSTRIPLEATESQLSVLSRAFRSALSAALRTKSCTKDCNRTESSARAPVTARKRSRVPTARMVLRTHFSASRFYDDLQRYHVTVVQYIGEILRYAVLFERTHHRPTHTSLLSEETVGVKRDINPDVEGVVEAAELAKDDRYTKRISSSNSIDSASTIDNASRKSSSSSSHFSASITSLRTAADAQMAQDLAERVWQVPFAFGNGLRKDVWEDCVSKLYIALPVEFYSSTEGNIFLFNLFGIPGVIGHIARFPGPLNYLLSMHYLPCFPFRVVRFDETTQELWRDARSGFGARVGVNEVGEILGEIVRGFDLFGLRRFDGYASRTAATESHAPPAEDESKRKVVSHVLWPAAHGTYFRSGDLVKFDDFGFCTFVDRVGETFRWKGENVSTTEVSDALLLARGASIKVQEAVVYGVTVPDCEGRAGMALLKLVCRGVRKPTAHNTSTGVHGTHTNGNSSDDDNNTGNNDSSNVYSASADDKGKTAALTACTQPTLLQERLFLQNELYACITGGTVPFSHSRAEQSVTTAERGVLPRYALPLFIRIDDAAMMHADDDSAEGAADRHQVDAHNNARASQSFSVDASSEQTMTSTFKYRKFLLSKEGFRPTPSGEFLDDWWGSDDTQAHGRESGVAAARTTVIRVYVLMMNAMYRDVLTIEPRPDESIQGYYVPLTTRTMEILGHSLRACGW